MTQRLHTECSGPFADLPAQWRTRAADLRRWAAAEGAASALERAAEELEMSLVEQSSRLLGVTDAANLVGRHRDTISNAIRDGRLPNHGTKYRPRVMAGDLAKVFSSRGVASSSASQYDELTDARSRSKARRGE